MASDACPSSSPQHRATTGTGEALRLGVLAALLVASLSGCSAWRQVRAAEHFNRGVRYQSNDQAEQAIGELREAIRLQPDHFEANLMLGGLCQTRHRWDEAEQLLMSAHQMRPNDPESLNGLGYLYAEQGIKLDEAIRLLERAVQLAPHRGHIVDSLGWAYYRKNRVVESVEQLTRAVVMVPNSAEVRYHRAMALFAARRPDEAKEELRTAARLDPMFKAP